MTIDFINERFIELPVLMGPDKDNVRFRPTKLIPEDLHGYFTAKGKLYTYFSGFGILEIDLTIEEFEKKINEFMSQKVTSSDKALAIQQRIIDKLGDQ